jgi:aminoglycoside phosphotransferase (APT) family kinase protein
MNAEELSHMEKGSLLGRGRTAEVLAWGEGRALKLYYAGWPPDVAEHEFRTTRIVRESGARAPGVEGVTQVDGRHGIVYERIDGPSLISHTVSRPWEVIRSAHLMAELHAQMHACRPSGLPAGRERLQKKIQAARPLSDTLKRAALDALAQLPDDNVLCHGDFHPDNIALSVRGPVILDWVEASCGHPLADVARTALLMQHAALPAHMPGRSLIEAGRALWYRFYLRHYCQLRSIMPDEIQAWWLPVLAARLSEGILEEEERLLGLIKRMLI